VILGGFVVVVAGSALAAAAILAHADAAIAEQVAVRVRKRRIGFQQNVSETSFPGVCVWNFCSDYNITDNTLYTPPNGRRSPALMVNSV
jgi:hypothetical protein